MKIKSIFKRYELKYVISKELAEKLLEVVKKNAVPDEYGQTVINNIYYDTDTFRLIRNSIEKPTVYKEKLRLRCYGTPTDDSPAFIELKKKYDSVVYKRRLKLPYKEAVEALEKRKLPDTQIGREIAYFLDFYGNVSPKMAITYSRQAFFDGEFRITFDTDIKHRISDLDLRLGSYGDSVTDMVVLELKSERAIPFWMLEQLRRYKIYKTAFSKYGTAYILTKSEREIHLPKPDLSLNYLIKGEM